jgi:hypothetical protein
MGIASKWLPHNFLLLFMNIDIDNMIGTDVEIGLTI